MSAIDTLWEYLAVAVGILVVVGGIAVGLMRGRGGRRQGPAATRPGPLRGVRPGRRPAPGGSVGTLEHPVEVGPSCGRAGAAPTLERPEAPAGRLRRLRARLARSNTALGKGLLALLAGGRLDEAAWEEVEDTLLTADLGVAATTELVDGIAHPRGGGGDHGRGVRARMAA